MINQTETFQLKIIRIVNTATAVLQQDTV